MTDKLVDIEDLVRIVQEAYDRYGYRARVSVKVDNPILDFAYEDDYGIVLQFVEKEDK